MKDWKVDAPLGPWCITWDIPNAWEDEVTRLARAVIATWQPVEHSIAEYVPVKTKSYKTKIGKIRL